MMDPQRRQLLERLQKREHESAELRGCLRELRSKFVQLERAFEMNLQSQRRREHELNHLRQESEELQKFSEDTLRTRAEVNSRLIDAISERDHWKNAFLRQKEFIKRCQGKYDHAVDLVSQVCEDILKTTREATEKYFEELVDLYNDAKNENSRLEAQAELYRNCQRIYENRSLELANLLETLKRFDVHVTTVYHIVAEALKNLTGQGNLFEEKLKNLRHLTWTTKEGNGNAELLHLTKQNLVLREIVKNLKRKLQIVIPERENGGHKDSARCENEINPLNFNGNNRNKETPDVNYVVPPRDPFELLVQENCAERCAKKGGNSQDKCGTLVTNEDTCTQLQPYDNEIIISDTDTGTKVLRVESHSNGIFYEEHLLKFSSNREIKIKCPRTINNDATQIKLEFVDEENEYDKESFDRILIFLKNIYACVKIKRTGISCSTQTQRIKTINHFTQTSSPGIQRPRNLGNGITMLNSEKRAMEKSLRNLEQTVSELKCSALGQAQTMIGKDSQFHGNDEFFECIRALAR